MESSMDEEDPGDSTSLRGPQQTGGADVEGGNPKKGYGSRLLRIRCLTPYIQAGIYMILYIHTHIYVYIYVW